MATPATTGTCRSPILAACAAIAFVVTLALAAVPGAAQERLHLAQADAAEIAFWESVKDSNDPAEFEAFIKAYPDSQFVPLARIRLNKLKSADGKDVDGEGGDGKPAGTAQGVDAAAVAGPAAAALEAASGQNWVLLEFRSLTPERARELGIPGEVGVEVVTAYSFGPAHEAGIRAGDAVLSIGGQPLRESGDLPRIVQMAEPGGTLAFEVWRDGDIRMIEVPVVRGLGSVYALAQDGHPKAASFLAELNYRGHGIPKNEQEAMRLWRIAAEAGDAKGQLMIGFAHATGRGGVEKDDDKARKWYLEAAAQGVASAQSNLGNIYWGGRGVPVDREAAVEWYRKAARQGLATAEMRLGWAYLRGEGVAKDEAEAANWFRKAAARNQPIAMERLGVLYVQGRGGLPRDRERGLSLIRKALSLGREEAAETLKRLGAPAYDLEEIQRMLARLGHEPGEIDGQYGRNTASAIRSFQRARGLGVDGKPSLALARTLREAIRRDAAIAPETVEPAPDREPQEDDGGAAVPLGDLDELEELE